MFSIRAIRIISSFFLIIFFTYQSVEAGVDLVSFFAVAQEDAILIEWETSTEINNAGFYLNRDIDTVPPYQDISGFIPAKGSGVIGAEYQFVDEDVSSEFVYYYTLEQVDIDQNINLYGPISVTVTIQNTITPSATLEPTSTPSRTPKSKTSTPTISLTPTKSRTPIPTITTSPIPPTLTPTIFTDTPTPSLTPSITSSPTLIDAPEIIVIQPPTNTLIPTVNTSTPLPSFTPTPQGSFSNLIESGSLALVLGICLVIFLWSGLAIGIFVFIQKRGLEK